MAPKRLKNHEKLYYISFVGSDHDQCLGNHQSRNSQMRDHLSLQSLIHIISDRVCVGRFLC